MTIPSISNKKILYSLILIFLILFIGRWLFFSEYKYYKNSTASILIREINTHLPNISMKGRNHLNCHYKFSALDECYVNLFLQSSPEDVVKNKKIIETLFKAILKKQEIEKKLSENPRFVVTEIKLWQRDQLLIDVKTKE